MRCGVTKKVIFKSEEHAKFRAKEITTKDSNRRFTPTKFRTYRCEYCGQYHLTAK